MPETSKVEDPEVMADMEAAVAYLKARFPSGKTVIYKFSDLKHPGIKTELPEGSFNLFPAHKFTKNLGVWTDNINSRKRRFGSALAAAKGLWTHLGKSKKA